MEMEKCLRRVDISKYIDKLRVLKEIFGVLKIEVYIFINKEYGSLVIISDIQKGNFIFGKYQYENCNPLDIERCWSGFFCFLIILV